MTDIMTKELDYAKQNDLSFALANGILDLDRVHELCMKSKRERVLSVHKYAISPPANEGDRWRTKYVDKDGNRKDIRAKTKEELIDKLIPLYLSEENIENLTFHKLYEEWLAYKAQITESPNTILRHGQHYRKYLQSSKLDGMKVLKINNLLLETESNRIVKEFHLSNKEWTNVKTILKGMFEYARRMNYISANPMEHVSITVKFRQVAKKTGATQTYNTEELASLNEYLDEKYKETGNCAFMAVRLNFFMGLRVGELVALKWEDLDGYNLHVVREEVRNQQTGEIYVADHTKTNTDRFVKLVPKALEFFQSLPHEDEYIFVKDGKRLVSRQINYVYEKYAERAGVPVKSSHKSRKTYASILNANDVPLDFIREQLGHSSLQTTLGYIYNPLTESESYELLVKALSGEAQTPDPVPGQTANIVDFSSAKKDLTAVPKLSPIVPKIFNA